MNRVKDLGYVFIVLLIILSGEVREVGKMFFDVGYFIWNGCLLKIIFLSESVFIGYIVNEILSVRKNKKVFCIIGVGEIIVIFKGKGIGGRN